MFSGLLVSIPSFSYIGLLVLMDSELHFRPRPTCLGGRGWLGAAGALVGVWADCWAGRLAAGGAGDGRLGPWSAVGGVGRQLARQILGEAPAKRVVMEISVVTSNFD